MSDMDITKKFRLHHTTVARINDRYAKSKDYYNIKHKSGHPRKFTTQDAHYAVRMLVLYPGIQNSNINISFDLRL